MEQWQIEALQKLLEDAGTSVNVTDGRVYLHSSIYGDTRYHMVSQAHDGNIVVDQIDLTEKYQQRVSLEAQEVGPLLRALLLWHFEQVKNRKEYGEDSLGDLDDAKF